MHRERAEYMCEFVGEGGGINVYIKEHLAVERKKKNKKKPTYLFFSS